MYLLDRGGIESTVSTWKSHSSRCFTVKLIKSQTHKPHDSLLLCLIRSNSTILTQSLQDVLKRFIMRNYSNLIFTTSHYSPTSPDIRAGTCDLNLQFFINLYILGFIYLVIENFWNHVRRKQESEEFSVGGVKHTQSEAGQLGILDHWEVSITKNLKRR